MAPSSHPAVRKIVWSLGVAQIVTWATLYYSFPALLLEWERDLGWGRTVLSGAFTLSLVVSAVCAPVVGRIIDRGFGAHIFTGSAVSGGLLLWLLSGVNTLWQFYLVWTVLGIARAGSLYEACFSVLSRAMGLGGKKAITRVALFGGLAGLFAFSGAHVLVVWIGWRGTVSAMAVLLAVVAAPLIWVGCSAAEGRGRGQDLAVSKGKDPARMSRVLHSGTFWLLAVAFCAVALDHGVLLTHMLPLLQEKGIAMDVAVMGASMIGPMQVAGRLAMMAGENRASTRTVFFVSLMAMCCAALVLLGVGAWPVLLAVFVLLHGAGYGLVSILRPVATGELLGFDNFGLVSGLLSAAYIGASAAAPTLAAVIWRAGGYDTVIAFAAAAAVIGLIAVAAAGTAGPPRRPKDFG